jgi:hypothetical protein
MEDTINTLKYANRAKNIKVNIKKNIKEKDVHISKYDDVINALKSEIEYLNVQLNAKRFSPKSKIKIYLERDYEISITTDTEGIQGLIKQITLHFEGEISLRRDIIEKEKHIEGLKLEQTEKEYELFKGEKGAKERVVNISKEVEATQNSLNEKYTQQSEFRKKRNTLQNAIKQYKKDYTSQVLNNVYQYYICMLENMTLEHRKNINHSQVRSKELQIDKLSNQIRYRDEYLNKADGEFNRKSLKVKHGGNIKSLEELNAEPIRLPIVGGSVSIGKPVQQQAHGPSKSVSTNHRTYEYEMAPLKKRQNPGGLSVSKSNKIIHTLSKNRYGKSIDGGGGVSKSRYQSDIEESFISAKTNNTSSRIELEMKKKAKTILRKNIIGRYKNSPYLNKIK